MEIEQIISIIKENPNKERISYGREVNKFLEMVVSGEKHEEFFTRSEYFESKEIHAERKKTVSNKDMFARLLQKEQMVFSARGGSAIYEGLNTNQIAELNKKLDNIRVGLSLRNWIKEFANRAYEVDPMGVIFVETSKDGLSTYPTYKSIQTVHDYALDGQQIKYVCFVMQEKEVKANNFDYKKENVYYRFVDEVKDYIIVKQKEDYTLLDELIHGFEMCPALVSSDIPYFKDTQKRLSKLWATTELAAAYLNDRSIRDLSKKYHGFQKLVEPMTKCRHCGGTGYINTSDICSHCEGSGWNKISKVSDSIKIPLDMLAENTSLDVKKIFAYIAPDIETWNKQDNSLSDLENLISDCYWGTDNRKYTTGANLQSNLQETATKTMTNLQPVYARLERTAEWAEQLEQSLTYLIGKKTYSNLKSVSVKYGRYYILESTDEIYNQYLDFKSKGSPQYVLNDYLDRYIRSLYQNNPIELALSLKMIEVEPMVHYTLKECIENGYTGIDLEAKRYFSEWYNSVSNDYLFATKKEVLKENLYIFAKEKQDVNVSVPE